MAFVDYYSILGLSKSATGNDIKKAYRKLAKQYHPDANPNDENAKKKFQQINEANEVLSDVNNRKKYDMYGKDWEHGDAFARQRQQQYQQFGGNENEGGFSDFFSSMFGGRRTGKQKGQDLKSDFQINLSEAFTNQQRTIAVNGKNIRITIPAGIDNNQSIKLTGYGQPASNLNTAGDLILTFKINNDTFFKRIGNDLHLSQELNLYTAVLGGDLEINTLHGKLKLKVKPETQNNSKLRLKGKGFPLYKKENEFGDLFLTYLVKLPSSLTLQEIELFTNLQKISTK